ncbi:MAG: hypothetical protein ACYC69_13540 [Thermodesulfovibrionales bacterium]
MSRADPFSSSERRRYNHDALRSKIGLIRNLYKESNVQLKSTSQLYGLLESAEKLVDAWASGNSDTTDTALLFKSLHVERISSAVEVLSREDLRNKYLKDLLRGTLNFFERQPSHAKSILWELEVCAKIRETIPETQLTEPDVVVSLQGQKIAIPCKKIFSEKGVPKVLSNAVFQFEKMFDFGIVAINIDDLIPADVLLKAKTFEELGDKLHRANMIFLANHERYFKKYLSKSRIIAVIASTSLIADIVDESPKFNNAQQWAIWTTSELLPKHANAIDAFRKKVMS